MNQSIYLSDSDEIEPHIGYTDMIEPYIHDSDEIEPYIGITIGW